MTSISAKKLYLALYDILFINLSFMAALYFRFDLSIPIKYFNYYRLMFIPITVIYLLIFYFMRLYKSLWSYAGEHELLLILLANGFSSLAVVLLDFFQTRSLPISVVILACILTTMFTAAIRLAFRISRNLSLAKHKEDEASFERVLIVGAGSMGRDLLKDIREHPEVKYYPVGFVDDSQEKRGALLSGKMILGSTKDIASIVKLYAIDVIIIAIPSLKFQVRRELVKLCSSTGCKVKIVPGLWEMLAGKPYFSQIKNIDFKDILGRDMVKLDFEGISEYIQGQRVIVTGAGGSIGSEICRQVADFKALELIMLDAYENSLYDLQQELIKKHPSLKLRTVIASVRDKRRLERIFQECRPSVVFHAAAHKHVPLMELNPQEAVKNNVMGTFNIAECAISYGVKRFVFISTDKAVNPTNVMGASKRLCEMIIQGINDESTTEFVAVRFGNVLGSNGSVIPLFERQISEGGPVTVTHRDITRYFMLIAEAVQLVLQAGAIAKGGEIFVLDMGKPVKIYEMAEDIIRLSGYEPHVDISIEITGLRPGEKLYEELFMSEEGLLKTTHEKIFVGKAGMINFNELKESIQQLNEMVNSANEEQIKQRLQQLVPSYHRNN